MGEEARGSVGERKCCDVIIFFFFCSRECGFRVSLAWELYHRDRMWACLRRGADAGRKPLVALTH